AALRREGARGAIEQEGGDRVVVGADVHVRDRGDRRSAAGASGAGGARRRGAAGAGGRAGGAGVAAGVSPSSEQRDEAGEQRGGAEHAASIVPARPEGEPSAAPGTATRSGSTGRAGLGTYPIHDGSSRAARALAGGDPRDPSPVRRGGRSGRAGARP